MLSKENRNKTEAIILGTLIFYPELIDQFGLSANLFTDENYHRQIFNNIQKLKEETGSVSLPALALDMTRTETSAGARNLERYISVTLSDCAVYKTEARALIARLRKDVEDRLIEKEYRKYLEGAAGFDDFINKATLLHSYTGSVFEPPRAENILEAMQNTGKNLTLNGEFSVLQSRIEMKEGTVIVVGAGTGTGKSGFALNLFSILQNYYPCYYINIEMLTSEVYKRLASIRYKKTAKELSPSDLQNFAYDFTSEHGTHSAVIDSVKTPEQIRNLLRSIRDTNKDKHICLFVDHIGIMSADHRTSGIFERTTEIMLELRSMTKEFNCTIFVLAQINREGSKAEREPILEDLKGSGELEQSAHTVILLNAHSEFETEQETGMRELSVIVAKNRSGKTARYQADYNLLSQRISQIRTDGYTETVKPPTKKTVH